MCCAPKILKGPPVAAELIVRDQDQDDVIVSSCRARQLLLPAGSKGILVGRVWTAGSGEQAIAPRYSIERDRGLGAPLPATLEEKLPRF